MKDAAIDQILSDLEEIAACLEKIEMAGERTLCKKEILKYAKAIREHCTNIEMELMDSVNDNQRR